MVVLELAQGRSPFNPAGWPREDALCAFMDHDQGFIRQYPHTQDTFQPSWREVKVSDTDTAPLGFEWFVLDNDGRYILHSANYDSGG